MAITSPDTTNTKVFITLVRNPLDPMTDLHVEQFDPGLTARDFVRQHNDGAEEFAVPMICILNGKPVLRQDGDWDKPLVAGDVVSFVPAMGDPVDIIIWLVVLIVSVVVSLALSPSQSANVDNNIGETPAPDPTFDIRGQKNQAKRSSPVECAYGQVRHWPSYGAAPFNQFVDNDQFLYSLFCCGHGKLSITNVMIEDTPIEDFDGVEVEILEPGQRLTLFPDNVFSSTEVSNIELFGPNQDAYSGWSTPFVACPPFEKTTQLEVDLVFPSGMYFQSSGNLVNRTCTVEVQARLIDDSGYAAGDWGTIISFSKTLKTTTPQRYTERATVPLGRYEIRAARTNNAELDFKGRDQIFLRSLRAFLESTLVYPGKTMLAMKAKASNNLNDTAASKLSFTATRKLRVWDVENQAWVDDVATRNPIWAFVDIFTAAYGGMLSDEFLALDELAATADQLTLEGRFFDWVFDQRTTVWEAAKTVAKICRGVPLLRGSQITLARELPQSIPTAMFNPNNIIADSFSYQMKMREVDSYDGLEVTYLNAETWQEETVLCLGPDDDGFRPKPMKLIGCTDRTRAYRDGMYMRMCELLLRMNIRFRTGLEGHLPSYGKLIAISHDLPRWGKGGYVKDIQGTTVLLSREVTFTGGTHYLLMRKRDGSVFGPVVCTQKYDAIGTLVPDAVVLATAPDLAMFFLSGAEPATYMFGETSGTNAFARLATVAEITPSNNEEVEMLCLTYNAQVFAYDNQFPPEDNAGYFVPRPPQIPTVKDLEVFAHATDVNLIVISWQAVAGISQYVVETSNDGIAYNIEDTTPNAYTLLRVQTGQLWLRVSATNVGTGVAAEWHGQVGVSLSQPADVTGLTITPAWTGDSFSASWDAYTTGADIDGYCVRVFTRPVGGSYKLARKVFTSDTSFTYSYTDAVIDLAVNREAWLLVTAINIAAESATPAQITAINAVPPEMASSYAMVGVTTMSRKFRIQWVGSGETDLRRYKLWVSATNNFVPSASNLVYEGTDLNFSITVPGTFGHTHGGWRGAATPARFWRVAEQDLWGEDYEISPQKTLPAYNIAGLAI